MQDDIVRKLRAELERGISTEAQVVYVLVKIRKLLDLTRDQAYATLRLCCNWVVHVELSFSQAQKIVRMADGFYPKLLRGGLTQQEKEQFSGVFSLATLRGELEQFLRKNRLPTLSDQQWNSFLAGFLNTIEDCPLVCKEPAASSKPRTRSKAAQGRHGRATTKKTPRGRTSEIDEVVLIKEVGDTDRRADGNPPSIIWALLFRGRHKFTVGANFEIGEIPDALINFEQRRKAAAGVSA